MKILRICELNHGMEAVGITLEEGILNFTHAYQEMQVCEEGSVCLSFNSPLDMLEAGFFKIDLFQDVVNFARNNGLERFLVPSCRFLSPIARPSKIIAMGRNYMAHIQELGHAIPKEPVYFSKLNSSVIGPDESVVYKSGLTRVDYEIELAIVIGQECANISEDEAYEYVAGYTIVNDVTARDMQTEDLKTANPWTRSKGIDTFCPMGPCIVTPDDIPDPNNLDLELCLNDEVMQQDNTRNMIFKIPQIISAISRLHTLYPGDVIPTGTPEGIGPVQPGDIMECYIENIGILRNTVVAEFPNEIF